MNFDFVMDFNFSLILAVTAALLVGLSFLLFTFDYLEKRATERNKQEKKQRLGLGNEANTKNDPLKTFLKKTPLCRFIKRSENQHIKASYERDLPACLEVVALGMQAGMNFDQAFALYTERFKTPLAECCGESLVVWQRGLISRDEGFRELAQKVGTPSFKHFNTSVLRALRFGSPLAPLLLDLADEARKEYRVSKQEMVAKAPVKMLLPTGVLILPAMLLLVMGPIILDLIAKM